MKRGTGILPVYHGQDAHATLKHAFCPVLLILSSNIGRYLAACPVPCDLVRLSTRHDMSDKNKKTGQKNCYVGGIK